MTRPTPERIAEIRQAVATVRGLDMARDLLAEIDALTAERDAVAGRSAEVTQALRALLVAVEPPHLGAEYPTDDAVRTLRAAAKNARETLALPFCGLSDEMAARLRARAADVRAGR